VVQVNGEVDKKDDSGNETGAGEHEQEDDENCYDKTKSFFDTISCEAVERSKGMKFYRNGVKFENFTIPFQARPNGLIGVRSAS
jgi:hypothetical protein